MTSTDIDAAPMLLAVGAAIVGPLIATIGLALRILLVAERPSEAATARVMSLGLAVSLLGSVVAAVLLAAGGPRGEIEFVPWVRLGAYEFPILFLVDTLACAFSLLAAALTALMGQFSRTYLHREPGFARFFVLLGLFATGVQLVAFAGALGLFFAGWELMGIASAMFIGFFSERIEPVRSSIRAFATYRLCDVGFFLAIVAADETLGSTRLSSLGDAAALPAWQATTIAMLLVVAALGKSAQLPFSSWLPRALEGPTPSSALFYGGISIHAGLYMLLRVHPVLDVALAAEAVGVIVGLLTAVYATLVARVQTDAKGALAFSTMGQTGLILAEISAGFTTLALVHLIGHVLLRVAQYLVAPSTIQEHSRRGRALALPAFWEGWLSERGRVRLHAAAVHRFRLDDAVDALLAPALGLARGLDRLDRRVRALISLDRGDA